MRTLIIGGGAAGMAAAIAAAAGGERVTVLERNRRPLKKLGVTGNGRGNLLNSGAPVFFGDSRFALDALAYMPYARVRAFWESLGLTLTEESEGRVYPAALQAGVAVEAMLARAAALGVSIRESTRAVSAELCGGEFRVCATRSEYAPERTKAGGKVKAGALLGERPVSYEGDRLIIAVGGAAAPAHGTDGESYGLLLGFGHSLTPIRPALCALLTEEAALAGLAGLRVRAALRLTDARGGELRQSAGEALFAQDGVSGIAAMQLARFVRPDCRLHMDLREALFGAQCAGVSAERWLSERVRAFSRVPLSALFTGAACQPLARALLRTAGVMELSRPAADLARGEIVRLSGVIEDFTLAVKGTRGFEQAQVTAGGVQAADFNPATMESRLVPGLYAAGEALDVDGDCGGYNLLFAVASGLLAGGANRICSP